MRILRERETETSVEYSLSYQWLDHPGAGFGFPCDESGRVDRVAMKPSGRANYDACALGIHAVRLEGVLRFENRYTSPRIGECEDCGGEVILDAFTCTCRQCGADYNMSGQRLAPREQWGEETGEHWTDCV